VDGGWGLVSVVRFLVKGLVGSLLKVNAQLNFEPCLCSHQQAASTPCCWCKEEEGGAARGADLKRAAGWALNKAPRCAGFGAERL